MFRGIRKTLRRLLGPPLRRGPPVITDATQAAVVRSALVRLLETSPARFARCFLHVKPLLVSRAERALFETLTQGGLGRYVMASLWMPGVRVIPIDKHLIAADPALHDVPDQVFSPMFEQVYCIRNMDVRPTDEVLEIGVGSGVLSLAAAVTARSVTAVDRSERALAFARLNRALNPTSAPVHLKHGSLFEPLSPDKRFDLILINPPFEPVPPGKTLFLHSDGGEDGLDVVRAILADAPARLAPDGRIEMITWSPGSAEDVLLLDLMRAALPGHHLEADILETWPFGEHAARFTANPNYDAWRADLTERGLTHLHFVFVRASPAATHPPGLSVSRPVEEVATCHAIADAWLA